MFLPTDVTLKVEGKRFYLNKKRLSENSPVFKAMFESYFEEKHAEVIPLPMKKFKDFEMFLSSFYFPHLYVRLQVRNDMICEMWKHYTINSIFTTWPMANPTPIPRVRDSLFEVFWWVCICKFCLLTRIYSNCRHHAMFTICISLQNKG